MHHRVVQGLYLRRAATNYRCKSLVATAVTKLLQHLPGAFRRLFSRGRAISEIAAVCQSGAVFEDLTKPLVLACDIMLSFLASEWESAPVFCCIVMVFRLLVFLGGVKGFCGDGEVAISRFRALDLS